MDPKGRTGVKFSREIKVEKLQRSSQKMMALVLTVLSTKLI